jgi:hypothetical protein
MEVHKYQPSAEVSSLSQTEHEGHVRKAAETVVHFATRVFSPLPDSAPEYMSDHVHSDTPAVHDWEAVKGDHPDWLRF